MKATANDTYGEGLLAYWEGKKNAVFTVESDIAETEKWPVSTFFRSYRNMPEIEQKALSHVQGTVLDIGAGAGSHALWLQQQGSDVTAIDISTGAVEVMQQRGIKKVLRQDFFTFRGEKFDTLLMLMNGIGITGQIKNLPHFFEQAKQLLNPEGKIILDSSDLIYLFEEEDGSVLLDLNGEYYGELEYTFNFGKSKGEPFKWLFVDFDTLCEYAEKSGFACQKLFEDDHYLYLAELTLKP
ncbi:class I SAM-dependent methyltransferase [Paludibacter sp. 221]|uniref:class I SAM-dependent methyltransferase n=1 Tax=Paludibacter sp. 221 TaxID=2302939 RepID=UPI0013D5E16A|nr:class I SAM-dependent methyltransferase [Paludibacter sp. 221]NDV46609.1 class I SAM-dependent methyltransferase [Paludibacter sp. 221]